MSSFGIAEARRSFGDLCRQVATQRERIAITDHGTTVAVLISPAELDALDARAQDHTDPGSALT